MLGVQVEEFSDIVTQKLVPRLNKCLGKDGGEYVEKEEKVRHIYAHERLLILRAVPIKRSPYRPDIVTCVPYLPC
jgi:hypothetical protein